MRNALVLIAALGGAVVYGCYTGPNLEGAPTGPGTATTPTEPTKAAGSTGLPCDLANLLAKDCGLCHADAPTRGAKYPLLTRAHLTAKDADGRTLAEVSLERMRDTEAPMPPDGLLATSDVDVLARWIDDGMPEGSCGETPAIPKPELKCTSGRFWTEDEDEGDKLMSPGHACIACHLKEVDEDKKKDDEDEDEDDDILFTAAGTVYPSLMEPDDCFGLGSLDARVVIKGADGRTVTLSVNQAGNFYTTTPIALPYTASVVRGGKTSTMKTPQENGDCNTCHSESPTEAPGRIVGP